MIAGAEEMLVDTDETPWPGCCNQNWSSSYSACVAVWQCEKTVRYLPNSFLPSGRLLTFPPACPGRIPQKLDCIIILHSLPISESVSRGDAQCGTESDILQDQQ